MWISSWLTTLSCQNNQTHYFWCRSYLPEPINNKYWSITVFLLLSSLLYSSKFPHLCSIYDIHNKLLLLISIIGKALNTPSHFRENVHVCSVTEWLNILLLCIYKFHYWKQTHERKGKPGVLYRIIICNFFLYGTTVPICFNFNMKAFSKWLMLSLNVSKIMLILK